MNYKALAKRAASARKHSHSPYSRFKVGAALLAANGQVYTGCNIEISTFALTVCGERTALFKAFSEGERKFTAIAVATDEPDFTPPCGACRQVIMDLAGDIDFVMSRKNGDIKVLKMSQLFPYPFGAQSFTKGKKKTS
ncbi:cytidine deaminase [Sphingobacteriales bacterium CHB3]|nr:cytidine deaminase [Sphingobacteriales bacterium CHB3]